MKTNRELKEAYKLMKPVIGVFQVLNKANQKVLIEESTNVTSKWNRHRTELRFGSHRNKDLQNDWVQYGEEQFVFSMLSELEIKEDDNFNINHELSQLKELVVEDRKVKKEFMY